MLHNLRTRAQGEEGFTLIELLVVILIIGILAAIALPTFLGQRVKGMDAAAKSDARNAVSQMESCFTDAETYASCPLAADYVPPSGTSITGQSTTGYVVTTTSKSNNVFIITKTAAATTRTCTVPSGNNQGGCTASWTT